MQLTTQPHVLQFIKWMEHHRNTPSHHLIYEKIAEKMSSSTLVPVQYRWRTKSYQSHYTIFTRRLISRYVLEMTNLVRVHKQVKWPTEYWQFTAIISAGHSLFDTVQYHTQYCTQRKVTSVKSVAWQSCWLAPSHYPKPR